MDTESSSASASRHLNPQPTAIAQSSPYIAHHQLRDLVSCPHEQGVVIYPMGGARQIVEQNLNLPNAPIRTLTVVPFSPSAVAAMGVGPDDKDTLIAAAGSEFSRLHVSYHEANGKQPLWGCYTNITTRTFDTSVFLTKANLSSSEPRVGVTDNDNNFRLYDVATRKPPSIAEQRGIECVLENDPNPRLVCVGALKINTAANHASIAPSGRMLLTVGDSKGVHLHYISGSSRSTFHPMATIPFPPPQNMPPHLPTEWPSQLTAAFATAWSKDGSKYAVGTQEGVMAIYDIRSTKPVKVFQTNKLRESQYTLTPFGVRCVKFGGDENGVNETLVFTEHTSVIHVVDGKTFEHEEVITVPAAIQEPPPVSPPLKASFEPHLDWPLSFIQLDLPPAVTVAVSNTYRYSFSPFPPLSLPPLAPTAFAAWQDNPSSQLSSALPQGLADWCPSEEKSKSIFEDEDNDHDDFLTYFPMEYDLNQPRRKPNTALSNGYIYERPEWEYDHELDIAGVCFDPTGKWLYAATRNGVVEWELQDRHT